MMRQSVVFNRHEALQLLCAYFPQVASEQNKSLAFRAMELERKKVFESLDYCMDILKKAVQYKKVWAVSLILNLIGPTVLKAKKALLNSHVQEMNVADLILKCCLVTVKMKMRRTYYI